MLKSAHKIARGVRMAGKELTGMDRMKKRIYSVSD
jgi:hypothetical protein